MRKLFVTLLMSVATLSGVARASAFSAPQQDSVLRFAFVTDTHLARNSNAIDDLSACLRDINKSDSLDFVLFGAISRISVRMRRSESPKA